MESTIDVYFIWYGDKWEGNTALTILPGLIAGLSGSDINSIQTSYSIDGTFDGARLKNSVTFAGNVSDFNLNALFPRMCRM
jgi:hypothetical protein